MKGGVAGSAVSTDARRIKIKENVTPTHAPHRVLLRITLDQTDRRTGALNDLT